MKQRPSETGKPVSDLDGAELCYWVARVEEKPNPAIHRGRCLFGTEDVPHLKYYDPLNDGNQLLALIVKYGLAISNVFGLDGSLHSWEAKYPVLAADEDGDVLHVDDIWASGPTLQTAICRAIVASKFGERVPAN